jgi:hypothetical protein
VRKIARVSGIGWGLTPDAVTASRVFLSHPPRQGLAARRHGTRSRPSARYDRIVTTRTLASLSHARRREHRRLYMEIPEDRTPVSETIGAALSVAGLAAVARTALSAPPSSFPTYQPC